MLDFFDYLFYRCYCYYLKTNKDGGAPTYWASLIVSAGQGLNIIGLLLLYSLLMGKEHISKYEAAFAMIGLLVVNFIRYNFFIKFLPLYEKWHKEPKAEKVRKGKRIVAYLIGSLAFVVALLPLLKQLLS
jgi:hypothetical protein